MITTIINRTEQKYLLSDIQYEKLLDKIKTKLTEDKYFSETIYNIYFDNDNYEMINHCLNKPIYKEKIRLRSYNKPTNQTQVFLKIKKKLKTQSNKRRIIASYQEMMQYINKGILPNSYLQITKEIDYYFKHYQLKPKIKILYDRLAYYLTEDKEFRITFDRNIRYSINNLNLQDEKTDRILLKKGCIMEVKTLTGLPLWLNKELLELKIYPISYSKVGKIYEQLKESENNVQ